MTAKAVNRHHLERELPIGQDEGHLPNHRQKKGIRHYLRVQGNYTLIIGKIWG